MAVSQDLAGRRAVVTGGASGLGRAIAARLSASGAMVTVVDLERALPQVPEGQRSFACDVSAPDTMGMLAALADDIGIVDIVVANAGVVPPWRGMRDLDADEWGRVMAVNVWGVAATIGGFAVALERSDHGSVIVMASINGFRAHASQVLYTASKHAVIGVMRAAALDLGRDGTRVNALAPGPIANSSAAGTGGRTTCRGRAERGKRAYGHVGGNRAWTHGYRRRCRGCRAFSGFGRLGRDDRIGVSYRGGPQLGRAAQPAPAKMSWLALMSPSGSEPG